MFLLVFMGHRLKYIRECMRLPFYHVRPHTQTQPINWYLGAHTYLILWEHSNNFGIISCQSVFIIHVAEFFNKLWKYGGFYVVTHMLLRGLHLVRLSSLDYTIHQPCSDLQLVFHVRMQMFDT